MLADPTWAQWSNREIGRRSAVDEGTVRRRREGLSTGIPQIDLRLVSRGGTVYPMQLPPQR
jgi:hypothetical protein